MKKQMFALFISCLFGAFYLNAQSVDAETAQTVALHFFNSRNVQNTTEMHRVPGVEAAYYIFEPINGEGFVMVSSQRSLTPILAYSLTQKFNLNDAPDNLKAWMGNYDQQIKVAASKHTRADRDMSAQWTNLLSGRQAELRGGRRVEPLLTTKWGQEEFYNNLCPQNSTGRHAKTGCVATAMAQIMKYWNYPLAGRGSVDYEDDDDSDEVFGRFTANLGASRYNWSAMPDTLNNTNWRAVAQLMRDAGMSVEMDYGISASSAFDADVVDAMEEHFGYNEGVLLPRSLFSDSRWEEMLKQSLDSGIPVYYSGRREADNGEDIGHAWVCDGYDEFNHFHMNWGWNGKRQDIWFSLDNLNGKETSPYEYNQAAIFNLTPPGCQPFHFSSGVALPRIQVAHWIHASSTVVPYPAIGVVFDAGDEITLLPGFYAPEGTTFTALIEGCGGNNAQGNQEEEMISFSTPSVPELPTTKSAEINSVAKALTIAPNPFSGSTTVTYTLESEQLVSAQLLDVTGRLMASPISQQTQLAGEHQFTLDANNLPAGLYFLVVQTGTKRQTQRIVRSK